jgi:hypothetical protein
MSFASVSGAIDLATIRVAPVKGDDAIRWDKLMSEHHYLGGPGLSGERLRHVAFSDDGQWLALLGWSSAAFKCQSRDHWIGWLPSQQWRRLPLVVNNSRFLILPWVRQPHMASRILSLSVRRLDTDFRNAYGHGVLVAETFVDGKRYRGTCYRAAGWEVIGETRGYRRQAGRYIAHGHPKLVLVKQLHGQAKNWLRAPHPPSSYLPKEIHMDPLALPLIGPGSLKEALKTIPDPRSSQGLSHKDFSGLLTLIAMATLAGMKSFQAMADYVEALPKDILAACGCRADRRGRRCPPSEATIRRAATSVQGDLLDQTVTTWMRLRGHWRNDGAIAIDGKTLRGSHHSGTGQIQMVAACTHTTGVVLSQMEVELIEGELPLALDVLDRLPDEFVAGRMITFDALHTQHTHAYKVCKKGATFF